MSILDRDNDSICSVSTPPGLGAIAVVRLSGSQAIEIARKIARFLPKQLESHKVYYGFLDHETSSDNLISKRQVIDEVLVTYFEVGKSFTSEHVFEFSCHGSPLIAQKILQALVECGARLAHKGEFTYRAFINGRIDLIQAEGVLSLINSQSSAAAKMALRYIKGEFSNEINEISELLSWGLSRLEANIDFSQEDLEFSTSEEIQIKLSEAKKRVEKLLLSYKVGKTLNQSLKVVLLGAPNVGKSSLLNKIIGFDRAIVSPHAGTTRDLVEAKIEIFGQPVQFIDSAGLRQAEDEIEQLGVAKTIEASQEADIICFIYDGSAIETREKLRELEERNLLKPVIVVANKSDLVNRENDKLDKNQSLQDIHVSAKSGFGIDELLLQIKNHIVSQTSENDFAVLHTRQYELLKNIDQQLGRGISLFVEKASPEFVVFEIQESLTSCFLLMGQKYDDQIMDRVFNEFCLGK